jgi:hypothetical protein
MGKEGEEDESILQCKKHMKERELGAENIV